MAITPTDFEKIWSTNATTPAYTFTDDDYLEGWDFVGNLPPTRAMWNAIQKRTDEKMKYIFDNFGSPLVAPTVADMTDQNRVYVYTGSEVGYTAGDWYYYDEGTSAWVDGGVYNAVAVVTDATLTQAGEPADAKVTGGIFGMITEVFTFTESPGYFNSNGTIASQTVTRLEMYTDKKDVYPGEEIVCRQKFPSSQQMWGAYCVWDANNTIVKNRTEIFNATGTEQQATITMPQGACKVAFCYRTYGNSNSFSARASYNPQNMLKMGFFDTTSEESLISTITFSARSNTATKFLLPGVYKVDASNIMAGKDVSVCLRNNDNTKIFGGTVVKAGETGYFFCSDNATEIYSRLSSFTAGYTDSLTIYRVGIPIAYKQLVSNLGRNYCGSVDLPSVIQGQILETGYSSVTNRICTKPFNVFGHFTISISNTTDYKFACVIVDADGKGSFNDSGWLSSSYNLTVDNNCSFAVVIARQDNGDLSPSAISNVGLSVTSTLYWKKVATKEEVEKVSSSVVTVEDLENVGNRANIGSFSGRFKPCYDHLFVNKTTNAVIPHESLYHVRISHALGFNTIEANIAKTSDGVFFVNHLNGGKFGNYFHHVDGVTDISNISANSVTWDWIEENVRYNSTIPKYQTRPARLEEFLNECKQNNLIPFATSSDADAVAIIEGIMGKDNYIAYNGTRGNCPSAIIYKFYTSHTTKQDILDACESFGKPFIYGLGNPSDFTDANLQDVVDTLHEKGYWIGTSYADTNWYKYSAMGFDFNGTQQLVNRIETGNLHNISSQFGFNSYTYTNATETDGVLSYYADGSISPTIDNTTYPVCMIDLEMWFNGKIRIPVIGEYVAGVYTSDGTRPVFVSIPIINGSPKVVVTVYSGTDVFDVYYKASVC